MNIKEQSAETVYDVLALLTYAILITTFLFLTQTIFSGFHLSDDQVLIRFNNLLQSKNFFNIARQEIYEDLFLRFRPLAIFYYLAVAKFLYPNFLFIALFVAGQGILSCYFFYRFCRVSQFKMLPSFLFPFFIFFGNQGVIFWRNCVNETLAMLLLSISFYFMALSLRENKNRHFYTILFSIFLLLASLTKESFIILIPALIFYKVWQQSLVQGISFKRSIAKNSILIIGLIIIMLLEIVIIFYYKSISNRFLNYVSIDKQTFSFSHLLISTTRLWITKGYLLTIIPTICYVLITATALYKKQLFRFYLMLFVNFILVTIPQIILYSKSLIFERYLLPGTLGSALLIIYLDDHFNTHFRYNKILGFFLPACMLLLSLQTVLMFKGARIYANDGLQVNAMLSHVKKTQPNEKILIVTQPTDKSEQSQSIKLYLESEIGGSHKNVYIEPVIDNTPPKSAISIFEKKNLLLISEGIMFKDIPDKMSIKQIIFFPGLKEKFQKNYSDFHLALYYSNKIGKFEVLEK